MYIWGKGRAAGRVGTDFLSAIAGRVESGQRFAGSGRVGSKKSDPWTTLIEHNLLGGHDLLSIIHRAWFLHDGAINFVTLILVFQ